VSRVDLNGTVYVISTPGVTATTAINDRVVINAGARVLEIQGGRLTMDGADYGRVSSGDQIRLAGDGTLTVNGERRHPRR
jgi:hypothetical protein